MQRSRRSARTAECRSCSTGTFGGSGSRSKLSRSPPPKAWPSWSTSSPAPRRLPDGLEELRAHGLSLRSVDVGLPAPLLAGAKTTSYGEAFAARRLAEREGADEALLVADGLVLEAATANIWWRRGDELRTPATRPGVLPGVTRELVLDLEDATEGRFPLTELAGADEAFLTSSIREVMPVVTLDGKPLGNGAPGPAAARLQAALRLRSTG